MIFRGLMVFSVMVLLAHGPLVYASASETSQPLIANPAAVFCEEIGGTYRIVTEEAGERGLCVLSDGEEVDAWDYYRAEKESDTNG